MDIQVRLIWFSKKFKIRFSCGELSTVTFQNKASPIWTNKPALLFALIVNIVSVL